MTAQQTVLLDDSGSCTAAHDSPLNDICHLIWSGPDGRKVKVNLTVKFTDLIYKVGDSKKFYTNSSCKSHTLYKIGKSGIELFLNLLKKLKKKFFLVFILYLYSHNHQ